MSELDVERARFNLLQRQKANARKTQSKGASRFATPKMMAPGFGMGMPSTQPNTTEDESENEVGTDDTYDEPTEQNSEENEQEEEPTKQEDEQKDKNTEAGTVAADMENKLAAQQAIARNLQAKQTSTAQQEDQTAKAAGAKKQDEDLNRKLVRPAQHSLFTGSVLGAETIVGFIFGSALWLTWKTLELYKTVTGASIAVFDSQIIAWNSREKLEFICGATVVLFVGMLITSVICLFVYIVLNPKMGAQILPGLAETFNFI